MNLSCTQSECQSGKHCPIDIPLLVPNIEDPDGRGSIGRRLLRFVNFGVEHTGRPRLRIWLEEKELSIGNA